MNNKLILCGEGFLQEVDLKENDPNFCIGTQKECVVRFDSKRISEEFMIIMTREGSAWKIRAVFGVYLLCKDMRITEQVLKHGDKLFVHKESDNRELFSLDFYLDYGDKNKNFDFRMDTSLDDSFQIGRIHHEVNIADETIGDCYVRVTHKQDGLVLDVSAAGNAVSVNGVPVRSKGAEVQNGSFFSFFGYQFYYYNKQLFTMNCDYITTTLPVSVVTYQQNHYEYPKFIKNVRQQYVIPSEEIEVKDPKTLNPPKKQNILLTILPMLISICVIIVLRGVMGGGNSSFVMYSAVMMGIGLITTIINFFSSGGDYKKESASREKKYMEYLEECEKHIIQVREKEYEVACQKSPSLMEDISHVADFDSRLFERKREHDDFLHVRVGTGIVRTQNHVNYTEQVFVDTEDYLLDYPKSISDKYEFIQDMPVVLDLKNASSVGIVGTRTKLYQMAKNLILGISIEHFYKDVKLFYVLHEEDKEMFGWSRWLHNSTSGSDAIRNYMYDEESSKVILEMLYAELSYRDGMKPEEIARLPHYVIFAYRTDVITSHPMKKYYDKAERYGFTFLFFEEYEEFVNDSCTKLIFLNSDSNTGVIRDVRNGEITQEFEYEHIPGDIAAQVALKLGCVYVDEVSLASSLTKNISLFELLGIMDVHDLEIQKRWDNSKIYESMAAPLGVKNGDAVVCLDLHEKFHGPHGLVAGTTGSGKSEILQSYILSMATLFHPYEVGFIIIDFKGGGMVNQFRDLPHLNGAITNIDGREINRSLLSIKAELLKRQELFAQAGVNKIDDYIKMFKNGEVETALPHLILIVDEFAELKSEQPEFMKELISAARIGRSLGVHLILATQKPSGVVDDQIWSNSKFKLCLKVQTREDSNEVLKSPLAAEIREPGRAYLQVGNNEIFQLFQSAYSGAPAQFEGLGNDKKFKLSKVSLCGQRTVFYEQKPKKKEDSQTQLEVLVDYIKDYCDKTNIVKLPNICLPPLPEELEMPKEKAAVAAGGFPVRLGLYDNPSKQEQKEYVLDIASCNTFIMGSSQYGKTSLLQSIITELAVNYSPADVCIYAIDFGSMFLRNYSKLKHVGGVVTISDDEKIKNLFRVLGEEMVRRRDCLAKEGVTTFSAYREMGHRELPQIVLLVDNLTIFREVKQELEADMLNICRDGVSLGISVVCTATQTNGIGFRFLSNFSTRICFTCNNTSEYMNVFDRCRIQPKEVAGRAIIELNKEFYECQMYIPFVAEKEFERVELMRSFIKNINEQYANVENAMSIPEVPDIVTRENILAMATKPVKKYEIPVGIGYEDVKPKFVDLAKTVLMGVSGTIDNGKEEFVKYFVKSLTKYGNDLYELNICDGMDKNLEEFEQSEGLKSYITDSAQAIELIKSLHAELKSRYENATAQGKDYLNSCKHIVVILNSKDFYDAISKDRECNVLYKEIVGKYKSMKVTIVLSALENASVNYALNDVVKAMKEEKTVFVFETVDNQKVVDVSTAFIRENKGKFGYGDAFFAINSDVVRIRTVI